MNASKEVLQKPIFDPAEDAKHTNKILERQTGCRNDLQSVILIEDDDETGHMETGCDTCYDSVANSSRLESDCNKQSCWQSANGFNAGLSDLSGYSYDDDCIVISKSPFKPAPCQLSVEVRKRALEGEKRPAKNGFVSKKLRRSQSCSSDCEIIEDTDGKVRQDWEKAALKKRLGDAYLGASFRAESEESSSACNPAGSAARQSSLEHFNRHSQGSENKHEKVEPSQAEPSIFSSAEDRDSTPVILLDQQDSNHYCSDEGSEHTSTLGGEGFSTSDSLSLNSENLGSFDERASCPRSNSGPFEPADCDASRMHMLENGRLLSGQGDDEGPVAAAFERLSKHLFVVPENIQGTEKLAHPDHEGWTWRQQGSPRQPSKAQPQSYGRIAEAEGKVEFQSRQLQEFEERKLNKKKEEQGLDHKEQTHEQIMPELGDVSGGT